MPAGHFYDLPYTFSAVWLILAAGRVVSYDVKGGTVLVPLRRYTAIETDSGKRPSKFRNESRMQGASIQPFCQLEV
ncbi:hypothetical protein TGRH88_068060 [Toxoplasma gondii]|uniref:Uncharacterized protein n=1 Tax=Toxoplasma gondii TaxID=5811 RepID=A0A7J6K1D3_TOXGO|nr:hypothetical protein TGRH88_068060 [Toxoplasma gondii]